MIFLNEDLVKQIFFYVEENRPNALVATTDIMDFADKIEQVCAVEFARREHKRCVEIVSNLNTEVGKKLAQMRPE